MENDINSLIESLTKLKNLHESGVLTEEEMEVEKNKLLAECESPKELGSKDEKTNRLHLILVLMCIFQIAFNIWSFFWQHKLWGWD